MNPSPPTPLPHVAALTASMTRAFGDHVPAFDVVPPTGNQPAKGALLALHGGAWFFTGRNPVDSMKDVATRWADAGWLVLNTSYRPGAASVADAKLAWATLRDVVGPEMPMAVYGKSAGGHLGLMVATSAQDIDLVVAESPPTRLDKLHRFGASADVRKLARQYFCDAPGGLVGASPAAPQLASQLTAPTLIGVSRADRIVPPRQSEYMREARPDLVQLLQLEPGSNDFIHAGISSPSWQRWLRAEADARASAEQLHTLRQ